MPNLQDELEWQTRRNRINTKLTSLSEQWKIVRFREDLNVASLTHHAVEEYPTEKGPADYALFVKGKLLGIIEAKKVTVAPQNVLEQAKRYARGVNDGVGNWNGFGVPFLYATNGEVIHHIDVRSESNTSRKLSDFHTPSALEEFYAKGFQYSSHVSEPLQEFSRMRPYQRAAVLSVEGAIRKGKRSMLVAMATGTGKTYLTVAQIYRLMRAGIAKRVLFMVDRKALAAQAVREFNSFNTPTGHKFSQEYEVYSQRFRREDFGE
ncbi:MAG: DEAD/DEAH box helicase family protein, partial [Bacteroidota bacterium]